jgi:pSer/pThr/pTyr-binding forkhead associated (FHA) protein
MGELTLLLLRLGFLVLLWAFVFAIVYALRSDLFGQRARRLPAQAAGFPTAVAAPAVAPAKAPAADTAAHRAPPHAGSKTAKRLVITSGPREGVEIDLPAEQLTIGRSSESGLVIRDDYTSTHHARLMLWDDQWVIQDLESTNGTFLDGSRVTVPVPVPIGTPITIGTTSFELRR